MCVYGEGVPKHLGSCYRRACLFNTQQMLPFSVPIFKTQKFDGNKKNCTSLRI